MTDTTAPSPKPQLAKYMRRMIIILLIVFGTLLLFNVARHYFMQRFFAHFALPTVTISTTRATTDTWTPTIDAVGSVTAIDGVQVSPQVAGMITRIYFNSGQLVKKDDPLVQLDDRTDQQDLKNFKAQLDLAQISYDRQVSLVKTRSSSQASLDEATAQLQEAQAAYTKTQVLIDEKLIKAPFSGKIGIGNVNLGQYVSPGANLVNLQSLNPLHVQFSLPEQHFKSLYVNQPIQFSVDNYPGELFDGKITAIDAAINTDTRNILVEAVTPNDKLRLYPGMYANVHVLLPTQEHVVTVPQTAVSFSLFGDSVFVVTKSGEDKEGKPTYKAHRRYVLTGDRRGDQVAILKGIQASEEVVNSGQLKLEDGVDVMINNSVALPAMSPETLKQNRS